MFEVLTDWQSENSPGGLSVMYFDDSSNISNVRNAIDSLFTGVQARLDSLTSWSVRTTGKIISPVSGTLTGFWSDAAPAVGTGTLSGQPVSNASQVLMQWRTDQVVSGRLLQGRTYVPGLSTGSLEGGQLSAAAQASFIATQLVFLAATDVNFVIWHRPKEDAPGAAYPVVNASTWNELAVQRRRR